jgi:hypothetical protein
LERRGRAARRHGTEILGLCNNRASYAAYHGESTGCLASLGRNPSVVADCRPHGFGREDFHVLILYSHNAQTIARREPAPAGSLALATQWVNLNYVRHAIVLAAWLAALKAFSLLGSRED